MLETVAGAITYDTEIDIDVVDEKGGRQGRAREPGSLRRALRPLLPALSHWFGLKWSDIESMPQAELDAYIDALPRKEG
ncbi:MAG: hypothetical protein KY452_03650 [Actinobacteria bacterium]|nr:hypothetical protein [Actinomycetota bacterium]